MKATRLKLTFFAAVAATMVLTACQENDFQYRDISARLRLTSEEIVTTNFFTGAVTRSRADSLRFTFRSVADDITEAIVRFEALLVGETVPVNRSFKLEVVEEASNAPVGSYELLPLEFPADSILAKVSIRIKREVPGFNLTDAANLVAVRVKFRVVPNENFLPHGDENSGFTVSWCDYLVQPESWTAAVNNNSSGLGPFTQSLYSFFIYVTGETELTRYLTSLRQLRLLLQRELVEYNAKADAEGRPHWKADNGTDLVI